MRRMMMFVVVAVTGSTAAAQPKQETPLERIDYTESRPARADDSWIEIANPTPVEHGTELILVDDDLGPLSHLRVAARSGEVFVTRIQLYRSDGSVQNIPVGKTLARDREAIVEIPDGARIRTIGVTTAKRPGGLYTLHGRG